ncbi:hypothetical protein COB55_04155 [Candidatus Wolfebacteria bacterium]|nr:MAG: hypothetical protein COB55_04155 [Candidatus Wolfebacteria bacterium]
MENILYFIAGLALGFWIKGRGVTTTTATTDSKAQEKELNQFEAKVENKKKIFELAQSMERITNEDVEQLLGVSDATATRYLSELEEEEKIQQIGTVGTGVYYVLVGSL